MYSKIDDIPVALDSPSGQLRVVTWGGMTIEIGTYRQDMQIVDAFNGLPDNRCQCPHWGIVLKGRIHFLFTDHEEVIEAGQVFYAPPGHSLLIDAGSEYIDFSPSDELQKTFEAITRNTAALAARQG